MNLSNVCFAVLYHVERNFKIKETAKHTFDRFLTLMNLSNVCFAVLFHVERCFKIKETAKQFMMERNLSNICFFTANLLKRVLWNSARSHLLHTITPAICGFRNLRYFARSQNQQIAGFYCIALRSWSVLPDKIMTTVIFTYVERQTRYMYGCC